MRDVPARTIVRALADAARRWSDADFPPRVRVTAAAVARTGYAEPVVEYAFDRLFGGLTEAALREAVERELGALEVLDGAPVPRGGSRRAGAAHAHEGATQVAYRGVGRVTIVASDTTLGVAIPPLAFALCAKAHVTVKDRSDALVAAFAETLVQEHPAFAGAIVAEHWNGSDDAAHREHLGDADVVVAFGRDETLAALRAFVRPGARFVPFGHATAVVYLPREALADEAAVRALALDLAHDVLLYDGEGCLSPHAAFVERDGGVSPGRVAALLARACDGVAVDVPSARPLDTRVAALRARLAFRASQGIGAVYAGLVDPHLIAFEPPRDEPPPLLPRTLAVYAVDGPGELVDYARRHALPLAAVATTSPVRDDVREAALTAGAARVARAGALQDPPFAAPHAGECRVAPFVRAVAFDA